MSRIHVIKGFRKNQIIENVTFPLIQDYNLDKDGQGFVIVDGSGINGYPQKLFRINVSGPNMLRGSTSTVKAHSIAKPVEPKPVIVQPTITEVVTSWPLPVLYPFNDKPLDDNPETDDEIIARINHRFRMMDKIVAAIRDNLSRGVIVYGGPGTGKSFGVEKVLSEGKKTKYLIVKGYVTAAALYQLLYDNQDSVIVFDDSDSVLDDEISLNILKGALDSTEERIISWNTSGGINKDYPNRFEYKGRIIFITNKNFERIVELHRAAQEKGKAGLKNASHLEAMLSRCDYLDLTIETIRERYLRIADVTRRFKMLTKMGITPQDSEEVLGFMYNHIHELRELSLRTAIRIAGYIKVDRAGWSAMANAYSLKRK